MVQRRKDGQQRRQICLLVQTSNDWGRQVLKGVATYANEQGHWDFHIESRGIYERLRLPNDWQGDGVIARMTHKGLAAALRRANVPVVNVSWLGQHSQTAPKVVSDEVATSRLAAEHFLDKGFESFGYVGPVHELGYDDTLGQEFTRIITERGLPCAKFKSEHGTSKGRRALRIQYVTQAEVNPPTFVFFVSDASLLHFSYQRYLENTIRKAFGFEGTAIRLTFRSRGGH